MSNIRPSSTVESRSTERVQVDTASADAAVRLRGKTLGMLSCRECEQLLDGNFRVNDDVLATLNQAWECTVRLDCQLGEAHRPEKERNKRIQALAAERTDIMRIKADLESEVLSAKLELQIAAAGAGRFPATRLAEVLEANVRMRARVARLVEDLEELVQVANRALRDLGQRPEGVPESGADRVTRRWRVEFEAVRDANDALLKALRHPDAAIAVPSSALEERIDDNWRFVLELVGLLEKVASGENTPTDTKDTAAADANDQYGTDTGASIEETAKEMVDEAEKLLHKLLECKYLSQEASAKGLKPDIGPAEQYVGDSQLLEAKVWKFLMAHKVDLSNVCLTKFAEEMLPHPAAFGAAAARASACADVSDVSMEGYPQIIRFLTYNIFMRAPVPHFAHNNGNDKKDDRLRRFAQHLDNYEVICLQEAFGAFSQRRDWLIDVAQRVGFQEAHRSSTNVRPRFLIDGGLLILSRLPVVAKSSLTFDPGTHLDRLSAKGALYSKLKCGPNGPYLHVCTTHMQSTYSEDSLEQSRTVRYSQLEKLVKFLQAETAEYDSNDTSNSQCAGNSSGRQWPLLLCGTLNINGRRSAMDGTHSAEYLSMVQLLRDNLGEVRDLLFDVRGSHPVTYADTRLTEGGEIPAERVLTTPNVYERKSFKRQRLDYLFFFPCEKQIGAASTDLDPVVPATCDVEKFLVDRAKDVGAPITQLSDHYGVEASFAIVAPRPKADDERESPQAHDEEVMASKAHVASPATSGTDEVDDEHFQEYSRAVAKTLSRGHDVIRQAIYSFLEQQRQAPRVDRTVRSNFAPFELRIRGSDYDKIERIVIDISVKKTGDIFQVEYSSSLRTWADEALACNAAMVSESSQGSGAVETSNIAEVSQEQLIEYYEELTEKLAKGHEPVRQELLNFFYTRVETLEVDAMVKSNFPHMDFTSTDAEGSKTERIEVNLIVQRNADAYEVAYECRTRILAQGAVGTPALVSEACQDGLTACDNQDHAGGYTGGRSMWTSVVLGATDEDVVSAGEISADSKTDVGCLQGHSGASGWRSAFADEDDVSFHSLQRLRCDMLFA